MNNMQTFNVSGFFVGRKSENNFGDDKKTSQSNIALKMVLRKDESQRGPLGGRQ